MNLNGTGRVLSWGREVKDRGTHMDSSPSPRGLKTAIRLGWSWWNYGGPSSYDGRVTMEGGQAEELACRYLRAQGMSIVARNWRWRGGEVDIVAKDGPTLVFVEVKARSREDFGGPEGAVTPWKKERLWQVARAFLGGKAEVPVRFDVVALGPDGVRHIRDAFREEDVRPGP